MQVTFYGLQFFYDDEVECPAGHTLLREGDRGPGVLWIKAAAAMADPPYRMTVDDPYFGPSLKSWVQDFQQQAGLRADGLIGPETLQVLSRFAREVPG